MRTFTHNTASITPKELAKILDSKRRNLPISIELDSREVVGTTKEFDEWLYTDYNKWIKHKIVKAYVVLASRNEVFLEFPPDTYNGHDGDGNRPNYPKGYRYWAV